MDGRESRAFVFCESYITLFLALDLLDHGRVVTVITNNTGIGTSCTRLGVPVRQLHLGPTPQGADGTRRSAILQLRRLPQWVRANAIPGDSLYFSHRQYSLTAFALAQAWTEIGDVYLWDVEQAYPESRQSSPGGMTRSRLRRALLQLASGARPLELRDIGQGPVASIGDDFLERHGIRTLPAEPRLDVVRNRVALGHHIPLEATDYLICTQPLGSHYPIKATSLEALYRVVATYDPTVKLHPRDASLPVPLQGLRTYPTDLPAELLIGNVSRAVLALHSSVLLTAATLPGIKAICLVDLVEWTNPDMRRSIVEFIQRENPAVLQPRSLDELAELLS